MEPSAPELRLAPHAVLLRRSTTELQLGIEPSLVVPRRYAEIVRVLSDGSAADEIRASAQAEGIAPDELTDLLAALDRARLLRPARPVSAVAVRVVGAGPLGARVARELMGAGIGTLYLADPPTRASIDDMTTAARDRRSRRRSSGPDRLDQLCATLGREPSGVRVRRSRHFLKPEGAALALTLVAADGPEPDRLVTDLLRDHGAPHLLLRSGGDEVSVGPLVVPTATSCVRCGDLTRRDADPRWPWLLDQLTRLTIAPDPALLGWAAATATVQTLAFLGGGRPESLGHTLELRSEDHTMRLRAWPVHPECPCGWLDPPPARDDT